MLLPGSCPTHTRRWCCCGSQGDATITKETLTDHQQLAYWTHRYVMRKDVMRDPSQGAAVQQPDGCVRYEPPTDVPEFLAAAADAILATGEVMRSWGSPLLALLFCTLQIGRDRACVPCAPAPDRAYTVPVH
jgi:hypothetical protein